MLACEETKKAAAAELLEATKKAGALDLQVTEQTWCGVCGVSGQVVRAGAGYGGRKEEGDGHLRRALTDACTCLYRILLETTSARRCIMQAAAGWRAS